MEGERYERWKRELFERIDRHLSEMIALSDDLAEHPELSGQEYESARKLGAWLRENGFLVELPFAGMETAFRAKIPRTNSRPPRPGTAGGTVGEPPRRVALLVEYDALPGLGHACGHCVSAAISLLAGTALAPFQERLNMELHLIGTPNEENGGAKCEMAGDGVFDAYDMAMMVHLYDENLLMPRMLNLNVYRYAFQGKAAHASAAPWEGRNALNAAQLMMHGVDMLRQHVTPDVRMHGIYSGGGSAPNIVPEKAELFFCLRALERKNLNEVTRLVEDCARGAAIATQTTYTCEMPEIPYEALKPNRAGLETLAEVFAELDLPLGEGKELFGSSDAGNVSVVCPTFHPMLAIAERGIAVHTREFARAAVSERAHEAIRTGAQVIGLQVIKLLGDSQRFRQLRRDFED